MHSAKHLTKASIPLPLLLDLQRDSNVLIIANNSPASDALPKEVVSARLSEARTG
jgi:hypothetical protein